jgi:two-component system, OmpR family, sensor histidine kinase ResE
MAHKQYFLRRFAAILALGILFSLLLHSFISSRLIIMAFDKISNSALNKYLDQGEVILRHYLDGTISLTELDEKINPEISLNLTHLILLDQDGKIIAASRSAAADLNLAVIEDQARELQEGQKVFSTAGTGKRLAGLVIGRPVFEAGVRLGSVFAGITMTESAIARNQFNWNIFMAIWPLFLILTLLSLIAARHFFHPIRVLADLTRQIAGGKWGTTIDQALPGEMGSLARDFNAMSVSLSQTITSLDYEKNSMKLMLEGLREGIVAMDGSGAVLHQNGAALELLGGPGSPEYQKLVAELRRCIAGSETINGKLDIRDMRIEFIIRRIPAENIAGQPGPGAIALLRDVTASERLEQTRHDYVANISHELRTPLTAMRGLIEPLRDGLVSNEEDRRRCYDMISTEALRLSRLVDDLLELSGIQSGAAAFETESIDTADLMQDLYYRDSQLFADAGLAFELDMPEHLPFVCSNEDRIIQVLTIFLDNARKYTAAGGRVTLAARTAAEGVLVSVSDSGIGMDETTQRQIFERFFQGDRSRGDRGNGLGLAIAREILDKLGIRLVLTSKPGQGSTFTLVLPLTGNSGRSTTSENC